MNEPDIRPGDQFRQRVWAFVRSVPPGKVVTYGQVAAVLGVPFAARAVGSVLHHTPREANVPCQRVVNRWGRLAPVYGWGGAEQQRVELESDGVQVRPDMTVDLQVYQWWPDPLSAGQSAQAQEPVKILEYNPGWPRLYEVEKEKLQHALGHLVVEIHHVGSTSVPGLAAKPVIDILIGIQEYPLPEKAVQAVVALGYTYMGEYGIPRRHYFHKGEPRSHHVHIIELVNPEWDNFILFRDYLRAHPGTAARYEAIKREAAISLGHDRTLYTNSKAPFIKGVIEKARIWARKENEGH